MKKMILLASALALGGIAHAQDSTSAPAPQTDMTQPDTSATPPADPNAAPDASAPATPDASAPAQPGMDAGQPATDPSQGGMAPPAGGAQPGTATGPNGPVSMTPTQGPTDLPACSKTVTDNCKQGAGRSSGGGKAVHHRREHK